MASLKATGTNQRRMTAAIATAADTRRVATRAKEAY